jgi:hypothetical protein
MRSPSVEIITGIYIKLNNLIKKTSLDVTTYMRVFLSHYEAGKHFIIYIFVKTQMT